MRTTYIAMLRGINVSGRNWLAMEDLRRLVADAGGEDVRTYIQSGNAVFRSAVKAAEISASLGGALAETLGTRHSGSRPIGEGARRRDRRQPLRAPGCGASGPCT